MAVKFGNLETNEDADGRQFHQQNEIGEIDIWAQFYQRSTGTYSFYSRRSQKRKKALTT